MGAFGKIFGGFGNKPKDTELDNDKYLETIINNNGDVPLAISESNLIYAGYDELGGYYYLQTLIFGTFKIKTVKGASLIIRGNDYTLDLKSDSEELEYEYAKNLKAHITKIDFEIEKEDVEKIKKSTMKSLDLIVNNKTVSFTIYNKASSEEL